MKLCGDEWMDGWMHPFPATWRDAAATPAAAAAANAIASSSAGEIVATVAV
jgi:hypothetical protein